MNTKELLSWAFEIIIFAKEYRKIVTKINIYKTEEHHFGKKYYRINFRVLDEIKYLLKINDYEKFVTEDTDLKNHAWTDLNKIDSYKSFYSLHYSEEIVDIHYDWILTVLDSLVFTHKLDLEIKMSYKLEKHD